MLHQLGAVAQACPERHEVRLGTQRGVQQSIAMPGLDPRTVQDSTVTSWPRLDRPSAAQTAVEAMGFARLKARHPIDTRGGHGDRLETPVDTPVCPGLQSGGVGAKRPDDVLVVASGHAGHDLLRAHVHPSGVAVDVAHAFARTGCAVGRS